MNNQYSEIKIILTEISKEKYLRAFNNSVMKHAKDNKEIRNSFTNMAKEKADKLSKISSEIFNQNRVYEKSKQSLKRKTFLPFSKRNKMINKNIDIRKPIIRDIQPHEYSKIEKIKNVAKMPVSTVSFLLGR